MAVARFTQAKSLWPESGWNRTCLWEPAEGHLWGVSIERRGLSQISLQDSLCSRRSFSLLWREISNWNLYMFMFVQKERVVYWMNAQQKHTFCKCRRYFSSGKGWRDKSAAGRRAVSTDPLFYNNEVKNKKPMTRRGRAEPDLFFPAGFAKGPINLRAHLCNTHLATRPTQTHTHFMNYLWCIIKIKSLALCTQMKAC